MSIKNTIIFIITLVIISSINGVVAYLTNIRFIEPMFLVGLGCTVIIYFFSSKNDILQEHARKETMLDFGYELDDRPGNKNNTMKYQAHFGPAFYASLIFFLVGLVIFILLIVGVIPPATASSAAKIPESMIHSLLHSL